MIIVIIESRKWDDDGKCLILQRSKMRACYEYDVCLAEYALRSGTWSCSCSWYLSLSLCLLKCMLCVVGFTDPIFQSTIIFMDLILFILLEKD